MVRPADVSPQIGEPVCSHGTTRRLRSAWRNEIGIIIIGLLLGAGVEWTAFHGKSPRHSELIKVTAQAAPGAVPPHINGIATAPITPGRVRRFRVSTMSATLSNA